MELLPEALSFIIDTVVSSCENYEGDISRKKSVKVEKKKYFFLNLNDN